MKPAVVILATCLTISIVSAQIMTDDRALDRARSAPIPAGHHHADLHDGEDGRFWHVHASTGWDSLYMDRGVNVLGNGNGIYWWAVDVEFDVWDGGTITPGLWYGVGSHWNHAQPNQAYKEWRVFVDFTQEFGNLSLSTGWEYVYVPMDFEAENQIYFGAAYNWAIGAVTLTPSTVWAYNLGPQSGTPGGAISGGASYTGRSTWRRTFPSRATAPSASRRGASSG